MNKEILQKINNLAKFIFDESEYNKFIKLVQDNEFKARLFLDSYLEDLEIDLRLNENDDDLLSRYKKCHELCDIVVDFIINKVDAYEKGKQVRQTVRG